MPACLPPHHARGPLWLPCPATASRIGCTVPWLEPAILAATINERGTTVRSRRGLCQAHGHLFSELGHGNLESRFCLDKFRGSSAASLNLAFERFAVGSQRGQPGNLTFHLLTCQGARAGRGCCPLLLYHRAARVDREKMGQPCTKDSWRIRGVAHVSTCELCNPSEKRSSCLCPPHISLVTSGTTLCLLQNDVDMGWAVHRAGLKNSLEAALPCSGLQAHAGPQLRWAFCQGSLVGFLSTGQAQSKVHMEASYPMSQI